MSGIGAIARGALSGVLQNREDNRRRQREDLALLSELGNLPGFGVTADGDVSTAAATTPAQMAEASPAPNAPPPMPTGPDATHTLQAGNPATGEPPVLIGSPARSPMDAVRQALANDGDAAPATSGASGAAPGSAPSTTPAPAGSSSSSSAAAPRRAIDVARIAMSGSSAPALHVSFDPTRTPAAMAAQRASANQLAHQRLSQMSGQFAGTQFDPAFDYLGAERNEAQVAGLKQSLIENGVSPKEAETLARYHVDTEARKVDLELKRKQGEADMLRAENTGIGLRVPSNQERQAAGVIPETREAAQFLDQFEDPSLLTQIAKTRGWGNYLDSNEGRQFRQAANQFIQNVMLAKSGKAVTQQEAERLWSTYIPMPGDDAGTLTRKRRARELDLDAMKVSAGRALSQVDAGGSAAAGGSDKHSVARAELIRTMLADGKSKAEIRAEVERRGLAP